MCILAFAGPQYKPQATVAIAIYTTCGFKKHKFSTKLIEMKKKKMPLCVFKAPNA